MDQRYAQEIYGPQIQFQKPPMQPAQKSKKELIEQQLANMPTFDIAPKSSIGGVSRTGLKPFQSQQKTQHVIKQQQNKGYKEIQQDVQESEDYSEEYEESEENEVSFVPEIQKPLFSPQHFTKKQNQVINKINKPKQKSKIPMPFDDTVEKPILKPQNNSSAASPAKVEQDTSQKQEKIQGSESSQRQAICSECKQPLTVTCFKWESQESMMCDACINKKYQEVKMLQLQLINQKHKQQQSVVAEQQLQQQQQQQQVQQQQQKSQVQAQAMQNASEVQSISFDLEQQNIQINQQNSQNQMQNKNVNQQNNVSEPNQLQSFQNQNVQQFKDAVQPNLNVNQNKREQQVVQESAQVQQQPPQVQQQPPQMLQILQQMGQNILQSFPFIVQRKLCPCCGEVQGFYIVDQSNRPVTIQQLEQTMKKEHLERSAESPSVVKKNSQQAEKPSNKKELKKLMQIDERLAQIQIHQGKSIDMELLLDQQSQQQNSFSSSGTELIFKGKKQ